MLLEFLKKTLIFHCNFKHFASKVSISLEVFAKSIKNHRVFEGHFSKCTCFLSRGTPGNRAQGRPHERVFYYMDIRTLMLDAYLGNKILPCRWWQRPHRECIVQDLLSILSCSKSSMFACRRRCAICPRLTMTKLCQTPRNRIRSGRGQK